jgi:hypothetical protein
MCTEKIVICFIAASWPIQYTHPIPSLIWARRVVGERRTRAACFGA